MTGTYNGALAWPPLVLPIQEHLEEDDDRIDNEGQDDSRLAQPEDQFRGRREIFDGGRLLNLMSRLSSEGQRTTSRSSTILHSDLVSLIWRVDDAVYDEGYHEQPQ